MINGSVLRDFYVDKWRAIPELVAGMNDNAGNIRASNALAPLQSSLQKAVANAPFPFIIVAYQGYTKGNRGRFEFTLHHINAYIRAATLDDDDHVEFGVLMVDAIPEGDSQAIRYLTPHIDADPMDPPSFVRVGASQLDVDIWKLSFAIPEHAG